MQAQRRERFLKISERWRLLGMLVLRVRPREGEDLENKNPREPRVGKEELGDLGVC